MSSRHRLLAADTRVSAFSCGGVKGPVGASCLVGGRNHSDGDQTTKQSNDPLPSRALFEGRVFPVPARCPGPLSTRWSALRQGPISSKLHRPLTLLVCVGAHHVIYYMMTMLGAALIRGGHGSPTAASRRVGQLDKGGGWLPSAPRPPCGLWRMVERAMGRDWLGKGRWREERRHTSACPRARSSRSLSSPFGMCPRPLH